MPLIILTGYPSSGLTYRANQLISHFTAHPPSSSSNFTIHHISDDTLSIPRSAYDTARTEKDARAALSSAVKRHLGRETLVICDAMNYIKGFRYQMWCETKAAGTTCCVVHVAANPEQATNLHNNNNHHLRQDPSLTSPTNDTKQQQQAYTPATFTNLISRYEEPSASARWDSPLFTLPHSDSNPAYEAIATALFPTPSNQPKKNPTPATKTQPQVQAQPSSTPIKAHLSTAPPTHQSSNALYTLERETTSITTAIQNYISTAGIEDCAGEIILLPAITFTSTSTSTSISGTDKPHQNSESESESELQIRLPNSGHLTVAQLQRLKRQFVSLYRSRGVGITIGSGGVGAAVGEMDVEGFRRGFVGFLNASFDGAG